LRLIPVFAAVLVAAFGFELSALVPPAAATAANPITVGSNPLGLAADGGNLYVANEGSSE
jgi:DNA-binding beta-propeller fold protein YncE